jgi:hypothetical protein
VIATVGHTIVSRPLFGRFGIVSHKKKKRPQLSPRPPRFLLTLSSSRFLSGSHGLLSVSDSAA